VLVPLVVRLVLMLLGDGRRRADRKRHGGADHGQDESHRVITRFLPAYGVS
jgi:hypothetical protein